MTAGVKAEFRFTTRVRAAFRIEIRLLRETRRVLVYLPKVISKRAQTQEKKGGNNHTVFREWPFFEGESETR
jgi:hypothetical protein